MVQSQAPDPKQEEILATKISVSVNGQAVELDLEALNAFVESQQTEKEEHEFKAQLKEGLFDWHDHIVSAIWFFLFAFSGWFEGAAAYIVLVMVTVSPFVAVFAIAVHKKRKNEKHWTVEVLAWFAKFSEHAVVARHGVVATA